MQSVKTQNTLDIDSVRGMFPILKREINGKQLIYFDNAATSQKPECVINAITDYYKKKKVKLRIIPINDDGEIIFSEYEKLVNNRTKLVAVNYISNTLGTINPVKEIIKFAHSKNIPVLVDGAQAVMHTKVDVQDL